MDTLVGRARELALFEHTFEEVLTGQRAVLMLSGEPGIGKTRLLEELARQSVERGFQVAWGRMWEVGLTPPFWPWLQVLASFRGEQTPRLDDLEERASASARLTRFSEVAAFLTRRAVPLTILLDDVHAADLSSLQLLEYLLPLTLHSRVLVALALRDGECQGEVASSLSRIQHAARRVALPPLDRAASYALVGTRGDARRVFELSEGNPLFIEELLASARGGGALRLPPLSSVRAVIRGRVRELPEESVAALSAAAVVGREFRAQIVAHMLGVGEADRALAPVQALGLVSMTGPDRFRFSHALVAEALADELAPPERARLHLRAAQACERHEPDDLGAIAHHLLAAGQLAAEAAVGAAERAAARCTAQLAFEDAAALLQRGLLALALAAPTDHARRARMLCAQAEALQHAGRHNEAGALCDEAAAITRDLPGERELFARSALARGLEWRFGRTDPLLVSHLQEALAALQDGSPPLRAKLLARLAAAEQPAQDPREPVARALEAIAQGRTLGARDRLDVMYVATAALVDYVESDVLEPIHREVLALSLGVDRAIAVHTQLRLCFSALERVDRRGFDAAFQAFRRAAEALGLARWLRYVPMLDALLALLEGRFADARAAAAKCALEGDASATWLLNVHRVFAAWVETVPVPAELRAVGENYPPGRAPIRAWFAVQDGDRDAAREALAELAGRVPVDPDLSAMVAAATAFAGDREQAAAVFDRLLPRSGGIVLASFVGACVADLYDRLLLILAATAGKWDALDAHAERALSVAERLGSPVWTARVSADWADALVRRNHASDRARAEALRQQALTLARRLGMPNLIARCSVASTAPGRVEIEPQGALYQVRGFGEAVHVKASRGMAMLARLVQEPGCELHVLDLVGAGSARSVPSDAGPLLDARARAAYRERLRELSDERDAAEARADLAASERINQEMEALTGELSRAFGLAGRERRAGVPSERARSNAQRRIAHAIEQIRAASATLGAHLANSVHTGAFCVYAPGRNSPP